MELLVSRKLLADLRGCKPPYVSTQKLPKVDGKYNLKDPDVMAFILEPYKREWAREQKRKARRGADVDDLKYSDLEDEKLREDIEYRRKQSQKLDWEIEKKKEHMIPSSLMAIWIGHFASGIRSHFLNIGDRVARGDSELRDRIEKEIKKGIEKTLSGAEKGLKKDSTIIIKALESENGV